MSGFKNPISLLQETCTKLGRLPAYDFEEIRTQEFRCTIKVCDFLVEAIAKGKKAAKTLAAEAMLKELGIQSSKSSNNIAQSRVRVLSPEIIPQQPSKRFMGEPAVECSSYSSTMSGSSSMLDEDDSTNQSKRVHSVDSCYDTPDDMDMSVGSHCSSFNSIDSVDIFQNLDESFEECATSNDFTDNALAKTPSHLLDTPSTSTQSTIVINPVAILQEKMLAQNEVPVYEFINETNIDTLTYYFEVTAAGRNAIGSGSSKKEAKSNAALSLLDMLGYNYTKPVIQPNLSDNAIGKLQQYCQTYTNSLPTYEVIKNEGKAHQMIFTMKCSFGEHSVIQSAGSKQIAKHLCAKEMLEHLERSDENSFKKNKFISKLDENVNEKMWKRVDETGARNKIKLGTTLNRVPIKDYIYLFENNFFGNSDSLIALKLSGKNIYDLSHPKDVFESIMNELPLPYELSRIDSKKGVILNIFIKSQPNWSFMVESSSYSEAQKEIFIAALEFLCDM